MKQLIVVLCLLVSQHAMACWNTEPGDIAHATSDLLAAGDFAGLDASAERYLGTQRYTPSGALSINTFYDVLGMYPALCASDIDAQAWLRRQQQLKSWVAARPDSVTARLAQAQFLISYGWRTRGLGPAHTVKPEDSAVFQARVAEARTQLEAIQTKERRDPWWYVAMLQVGLAQGWPLEQFDALYLEGARLFPDALRLHQAALTYYAPNWHGSDQRLSWFIERVVAMTQEQSGQMEYARLYHSAYPLYGRAPADWPRLRRGFDDLLKRFPNAWNHNRFAEHACMEKDLPTLARQLSLIDNRPNPDAWRKPAMITQCMQAKQLDRTMRKKTGKGWSKY